MAVFLRAAGGSARGGHAGRRRPYGYVIAIRAVTSDDAMIGRLGRLLYDRLDRVASRMDERDPQVNRVTLYTASKPSGTIKWE